MSEHLTPRQSEILELIREHIEQTGYPPTRQEIAAELGFRSANAAEEHLKALRNKGVIEMTPGASRGIKLAEGSGIPVVGEVAAGEPLLAEQNLEGHWALDAGLFRPRANYLLRVKGESMTGAGILDGDLLAVHRSHRASNGQIVVARLEDEVTVKRFYQKGNRATLAPENPAFTPIELDLSREPLVIEGLGVGVLRRSL